MIEGVYFPVEAGIPKDCAHMISYHMCADGLYLRKKVAAGFVTVKVDGIGNLPKGQETIDVLPRKIPIQAYWKTVEFFRAVETKHGKNGMEAYLVVAYSPSEDRFFLWVPPQQVGAASVKYDISKFFTENPNSMIVMDIHSHTSRMGAFFSGTDDADDNRDRYSMVIGKINQIFPEHKIRFSTMKRRFDYDFDDVFENGEEPVLIDIPQSLAKMEEYKPQYQYARNPYDRDRSDYYDSWRTYGGNGGRKGQPRDREENSMSYVFGDHDDYDKWPVSGNVASEVEVRDAFFVQDFNKSIYEMIRDNGFAKDDFSIQELMGDDW